MIETTESAFNKAIQAAKNSDHTFSTSLISDGYHTFGELYEHH